MSSLSGQRHTLTATTVHSWERARLDLRTDHVLSEKQTKGYVAPSLPGRGNLPRPCQDAAPVLCGEGEKERTERKQGQDEDSFLEPTKPVKKVTSENSGIL